MLTGRGSRPDPQRLPGRLALTGRHSCHGPVGSLGGISMPGTRVTSSDPAPTLEDVGREFPDWHCYAPGINGLVFASLRGSSPLVVVRGPDPVSLGEEIRSWSAVHDHEAAVNLTASLQATAADLSGVANGLAGLGTDDHVEQQAEILDRVAEDASQGAAILRATLVRRDPAPGLPPAQVPPGSADADQVPSGSGGQAS
jgi:hypothetical protein